MRGPGVAMARFGVLLLVAVIGWKLFGVSSSLAAIVIGLVFLAVYRMVD
jgi:hypothetical protein